MNKNLEGKVYRVIKRKKQTGYLKTCFRCDSRKGVI